MPQYNGHRSWNAWNVCLWLSNSEPWYKYIQKLIQQHGKNGAARHLAHELEGERTPDGAKYNLTCIREALRNF